MPRPKGSARTPGYCLHKPSRRAYVTFPGTSPIYLGAHGSPESHRKYHQLVAEWHARSGVAPQIGRDEITVAELLSAWWGWAQQHYGKASQYLPMVRVLRMLYGDTPATEFGPLKLKAVREHVAKTPIAKWQRSRPGVTYSRRVVNRYVVNIKAVFRWGVENELIPGSVVYALDAVKHLSPDTPGVREKDLPIDVDEETVEATLPFITSPMIREMVRIQLATGMRSGELAIMRTADVDMSDPACWLYRPTKHKTQHHGKTRTIAIVGPAQDLLRPWLRPDLNAYLFSPTENWAKYHAGDREGNTEQRRRNVARTRRHRQRKGIDIGKRRFTPHISRAYYASVVADAARRADAAAHKNRPEVSADVVLVKPWTPHMLRHRFVTVVTRTTGNERDAMRLAGHSDLKTTKRYLHLGDADVKAAAMRIASAG